MGELNLTDAELESFARGWLTKTRNLLRQSVKAVGLEERFIAEATRNLKKQMPNWSSIHGPDHKPYFNAICGCTAANLLNRYKKEKL